MLPQPSGYAAFPQPLIHNFWLYLLRTFRYPLALAVLVVVVACQGQQPPESDDQTRSSHETPAQPEKNAFEDPPGRVVFKNGFPGVRLLGETKDTSEPVYEVTMPGATPIRNVVLRIRTVIWRQSDVFIDLPSSPDGTFSISEAYLILNIGRNQTGVALLSEGDSSASLASGKKISPADFRNMVRDVSNQSLRAHTFPSGAKVTPPIPIEKTEPEWPDGHPPDGGVTLFVRISTSGQVSTITPVKGPDDAVAAAQQAIKKWKYTPAKLKGNAVEGLHFVEWLHGSEEPSVPIQAVTYLLYDTTP